MLLFCLFWLPVNYFLWIFTKPPLAAPPAVRFYEKICAVAVGAAAALFRFLVPPLWPAMDFDLSRYLWFCVYWTVLPVALPVFACFVFSNIAQKKLQQRWMPDWTGFVLLALIPPLFACAIRWSSEKNPANLLLIPLLWSAAAYMLYPLSQFLSKRTTVFPFVLAMSGFGVFLALAGIVCWAFFRSWNILAFSILAAELLCFLFTIGYLFKGFAARAQQQPSR